MYVSSPGDRLLESSINIFKKIERYQLIHRVWPSGAFFKGYKQEWMSLAWYHQEQLLCFLWGLGIILSFPLITQLVSNQSMKLIPLKLGSQYWDENNIFVTRLSLCQSNETLKNLTCFCFLFYLLKLLVGVPILQTASWHLWCLGYLFLPLSWVLYDSDAMLLSVVSLSCLLRIYPCHYIMHEIVSQKENKSISLSVAERLLNFKSGHLSVHPNSATH